MAACLGQLKRSRLGCAVSQSRIFCFCFLFVLLADISHWWVLLCRSRTD